MFAELKERLNLAQVLGRYGSLEENTTTLAMRCPFHNNDHKPSLHWWENDKHFYCFGCKAHGDVIDFVAKMERVSIKDAATMLARENGLDMPAYSNGYRRAMSQFNSDEDIELGTVSRESALARVILDRSEPNLHPYLARKGFPKLKARVYKDSVCVPIYCNRILVSMQLIAPDGTKKFLKNCKTSRGSWTLGDLDAPGRIYVEGYATALSVWKACLILKRPMGIVVSFSASNLRKIAMWGEDRYIVADNDEAGLSAVENTHLPWWAPSTPGWDANDYALAASHHELAECLLKML